MAASRRGASTLALLALLWHGAMAHVAGQTGAIKPPALPSLAPSSASGKAPLVVHLAANDQKVLRAFERGFARDHRYDTLLDRVAVRLNPHLEKVFGPLAPSDPVTCHVFFSRLGFNARTWHRLVLVDSLLLDGLKNLAEGLAVDPSLQSPYVKRLAFVVAGVHMALSEGRLAPDLSNPKNPYNLPCLYGLTPAQRDLASDQFEAFVAAWMAHEVAHAYLGHTRKRYEALLAEADAAATADQARGRIPKEPSAGKSPRGSSSTEQATDPARLVSDPSLPKLSFQPLASQQAETEADAAAVRLLLRAGYPIGPMVDSLVFCELLERWFGRQERDKQSHPSMVTRIEALDAVARAEEKLARSRHHEP